MKIEFANYPQVQTQDPLHQLLTQQNSFRKGQR